jgi:hypothetical protein
VAAGSHVLPHLAIFAIEEFAHGLSPGFIRFPRGLALIGVHATMRFGGTLFGSTTLRTAIGETGLIRFQLKLFPADGTDFDRESHSSSIIRRKQRSRKV